MESQVITSKVTIGLSCLIFAMAFGFVSDATAQLNEKKIERDASGVYKGKGRGGRVYVSYDSNPAGNFNFVPESGDGKVRVPVKDGKLATSMNDNELPGDGDAKCKGSEQKSKVTRGGKKIVVGARGTVVTDEGPTHGPWKGGKITGQLLDRGAKWSADTACGAYQRNGDPPDHTRRLVGRMLDGKG
ncbi:MAG: hypothetical protein KDN18_19255 [Verrucomicrobiae bacterium]|nr:hypothetical protein [Verrucomicrobiae bacterium]